MGEAKRRTANVAAGGADWGMVGFKNSGGRRRCRNVGKMVFVAVRLDRNGMRVTVNGTAKRATPRAYVIRKMVRRAQARG